MNQINIEEALGCGGDVLGRQEGSGGERRVINKVRLRGLYISQSLMISSVFPSPYITVIASVARQIGRRYKRHGEAPSFTR